MLRNMLLSFILVLSITVIAQDNTCTIDVSSIDLSEVDTAEELEEVIAELETLHSDYEECKEQSSEVTLGLLGQYAQVAPTPGGDWTAANMKFGLTLLDGWVAEEGFDGTRHFVVIHKSNTAFNVQILEIATDGLLFGTLIGFNLSAVDYIIPVKITCPGNTGEHEFDTERQYQRATANGDKICPNGLVRPWRNYRTGNYEGIWRNEFEITEKDTNSTTIIMLQAIVNEPGFLILVGIKGDKTQVDNYNSDIDTMLESIYLTE